MSSAEPVIDGVAFVRSRNAARTVQLTSDYVTTLARGGFIAGMRVDGLWYVSLASLKQFIADQERQKEIWRSQLARMRREEQRLAGHPSALPA